MRVLHVIRNLNDGGMERVVADLLVAMSKAGAADLHVLSLETAGRFSGALAGHAHVHLARKGSRLSMLRPRTLAEDIGRVAPDIVHAHSGTWYKTVRAARMAGVPRVTYTEHGRHFPDPLLNRLIDAAAAYSTDSVIAVSAALGDYMTHRLGVARSKVRVILNGIDLTAVRRAPSITVPGANGVVTFVVVGRLEPVKGLEQLVDVLASWPPTAPTCRILIAGDGSVRTTLEQRAKAAGVSDRMVFLGWVEQPAGLYKAADAYLLPSHSEGTSISLLEAMAAGCPPIASAVGGNPEILGDALRDWLVPRADVDALRGRMVQLATSRDLRERSARAAEKRVAAEYSIEAMAKRYLDHYEELLAT